MAKIIDKGPGEKVLILGVREFYIHPFDAPEWRDLRVGFFLSVASATVDDATTYPGLAETIPLPGSGQMLPQDRYWIGLKDRSSALPKSGGTQFIGFTNALSALQESQGTTVLSSSDLGVGTTNAFFWRPNNSFSNTLTAGIFEGVQSRGTFGHDGVQQHFAQVPASAGGYATLLLIRVTRPGGGSNQYTVQMKKSAAGQHSGDVLFTNTPDQATLLTNLDGFPATVEQIGPVTLANFPDALYFYWPFHNSRLRIHAIGVFEGT
jgi:hypothetical protein